MGVPSVALAKGESMRALVSLLAVLSLSAAVLRGGAATDSRSTRKLQSGKDISSLTRQASKSVVLVIAADTAGKVIAQGRGFIVRSNGLVVTNFHVIENSASAVIKLPNGAIGMVEGLLGIDRERDLVTLKAMGADLPTLPLGDSDQIQVGENVIAIGNPLALEGTVSTMR